MEQNNTIAVKVQDRRHFDRLTRWLSTLGLNFERQDGTSFAPLEVWDAVAKAGHRIKAIMVEPDEWRIIFGDEQDMTNALANWNYLSTTDFKTTVNKVNSTRSLDDMPRSYRLLKDSVECRAGTIVTEIDRNGHYKVVTMDLRTFPEDSDLYFREFNGICFSRKTVEEQPQWFERVYQLDNFVTEAEYSEIQSQIQGSK